MKKRRKKAGKHNLEDKFLKAWINLFPDLPRPMRQHRFHPTRRWLWDFSWPDQKLAVEIQGGSFLGRGRHNNPYGQAKDYEKSNAAVALGWRLLLYNTPMMKDVESVVTEVAEVLCGAN